MNGYALDLSEFTLTQYKKYLKSIQLIPSQKPLLEKLDERMKQLTDSGMKNLDDILQALKNKKNFEAFVTSSKIPESYLTLLRRDVMSLLPKPRALKDFPGIKKEFIKKLEARTIKTTQQLFEHIVTKKARQALAKDIGMTKAEAEELTKLTDLTRIKYTSPIFARIMYESGFDTPKKLGKADPKKLFDTFTKINKAKGYSKTFIGEKDCVLLTQIVALVPDNIEY